MPEDNSSDRAKGLIGLILALDDTDSKEELIKLLLDLRTIRTEMRDRLSDRMAALNPLTGGYSDSINALREQHFAISKKVILIDLVIDFLNIK